MTDCAADENRDGVAWRDGAPVSRRFGDRYFAADGPAETEHVFLAGNDLPARWSGASRFCIAELGFGTGLNFLVARRAWRRALQAGIQAGGRAEARLTYASFERWPIARDAMARILAPWPDLEAEDLIAAWPFEGRRNLGGCLLEIVPGDARRTLPVWNGRADAWFLDGFAPAKNPELWGAALMERVARRTAPGGTFATYAAAGRVRRRLEAAGFEVSRVPGFGRKRHMSRGRLGAPPPDARADQPAESSGRGDRARLSSAG